MATSNQYIDSVNKPYDTPILTNKSIDIAAASKVIIPIQHTVGDPTSYYLNPEGYKGEKSITVTDPNGGVTNIPLSGGVFTPIASGIYIIRYKGAVRRFVSSPEDSPFNIAFYIAAVSNQDPLPKWNIRTVLERVLDVYKSHLQNEPQKYKLDPAQVAQFERIEAPEFAFTNKTLKEVLDIVGGYIHGIPRLVRGESGLLDTIHYDMLGGTEVAKLADPKYPYITKVLSQGVEDYVTELDSTVDNLVNSMDSAEGSTVEPFKDGYRTTRSEEAYARITDENMIIETTKPIYSVQKLEVFVDGEHFGDITPYVFEAAEYGRLSSFEGVYPSSKAYAIYYELGQKNIKGLSFKSPSVIDGAGSEYSISNIILKATGADISSSAWEDGKYTTISFRITYTPIFSARVAMHKPYHEPNKAQSTLFYNQSDNLVETRFYGENLKGAVSRMGNPEMVMTYLIADMSFLPTPGQMWDDDYYVAGVTNALYADYVECSVSLSKDFNRLSQYIGINSQWRAYEVSEKAAYNRNITYSDYAIIGDVEVEDNSMLTAYGINEVAKIFAEHDGAPLTAAEVQCYDENGENFATCTLPIISTAFGNVMSFQFGMADNYSAGTKSVPDNQGDVSGYWQTDVPYTDYYGRVKSVGLVLSKQAPINDYDTDMGLYIPQYNWADGATSAVKTDQDNRLVVDKNGGEILNFNYELQFVTTLKDIIIGPGLARRCALVSSSEFKAPILYVAPNRVGKFDRYFNPNQAIRLGNVATSIEGNKITLSIADTSVRPGSAWVIVDPDTREILIARNVKVASFKQIELPPIVFTHKLP